MERGDGDDGAGPLQLVIGVVVFLLGAVLLVRVLTQQVHPLGDLKPVNFRHLNVSEDQLVHGSAALRTQFGKVQPYSFGARAHSSGLEVLLFAKHLQRDEVEGDVIHHQNLLEADLAADLAIECGLPAHTVGRNMDIEATVLEWHLLALRLESPVQAFSVLKFFFGLNQ